MRMAMFFLMLISISVVFGQNSCPIDEDTFDFENWLSENQLVQNVGFEEGVPDPWIYTVQKQAAPLTVDCESDAFQGWCFVTAVREHGTENYHDVEVHHFNLPIERFMRCKLTIATRTDVSGNFIITLMNNKAPWQDYGLYELLETRPEWTVHTRSFEVNTNDEAARLTLAIGSAESQASTYEFDLISLTCVQPANFPL